MTAGAGDAVPAFELTGIGKRFGPVTVLSDVDFALRPGEIHALMGENGAGKSTLMKVAAGLHAADAGERRIGGERPGTGPADARARGVRTVFQELTVLRNLDVARNVLIGAEPVRAGGLWLDTAAMRRQAQAVLDRLGIALDAATPVARLSVGQRQMVEIARACATLPRALILDEPTSSLGRAEEEVLFDLMRRLRDEGVGIVHITHRMSEVFALADRITVLRDGRHVLTEDASRIDRPGLIRAMVGREMADRDAPAALAGAPVVLAARGLRRGIVRGADLSLHAGEITGLAGLMGAGRSELARMLAGADRPEAGDMRLDGRPFAPPTPRAAIRAGVILVPEDRKAEGLVLPLSVADNIALPSLPRLSRRGLVSGARARKLADHWMQRLRIRAAGPRAPADTLSGGNQQKIVLAKWLALDPRVVLLDEPTRGVDVGAKSEIYDLIRDLANDGAAILVVSSELSELLAICHRIAVMAQGRVVGEMPAADASEESLLALAFAETPGTAA